MKLGAYNKDTNSTQCVITQEQLETIEGVLEQDLVAIGVRTVLLVDMAGNIIANYDSGDCSSYELWSLAVLASANCVTMDVIAGRLGEREFSFHLLKGVNRTTHFTKVGKRLLLITVTDRDVSLGHLCMKIEKVAGKIKEISETMRDMFLRLPFPMEFAGETGQV